MLIERCRLVELMADKGHAFAGEVNNPRQREELQGAAKYAGLCGPMWDAGILRYESIAAYQALSM